MTATKSRPKFRRIRVLSPTLRSKIDGAGGVAGTFKGFTPEERLELARYLATTKTSAALERDMLIHRRQAAMLGEARDPAVSDTSSPKWSSHLSSVRHRTRNLDEMVLFQQAMDKAHATARNFVHFGEQ